MMKRTLTNGRKGKGASRKWFSKKYYPDRNRTLLGIETSAGCEDIEAVVFILNICSAWLSFAVVIICSAILIRNLRNSSRWRGSGSLRTNKAGNNLVTRDRIIVKMVVTVSLIFILLFTPVTVTLLIIVLKPDFSIKGRYKNLFMVVHSFVFLLEGVNSSVNILVYLKMSSKFRASFVKLFKFKKENKRISSIRLSNSPPGNNSRHSSDQYN